MTSIPPSPRTFVVPLPLAGSSSRSSSHYPYEESFQNVEMNTMAQPEINQRQTYMPGRAPVFQTPKASFWTRIKRFLYFWTPSPLKNSCNFVSFHYPNENHHHVRIIHRYSPPSFFLSTASQLKSSDLILNQFNVLSSIHVILRNFKLHWRDNFLFPSLQQFQHRPQ